MLSAWWVPEKRAECEKTAWEVYDFIDIEMTVSKEIVEPRRFRRSNVRIPLGLVGGKIIGSLIAALSF